MDEFGIVFDVFLETINLVTTLCVIGCIERRPTLGLLLLGALFGGGDRFDCAVRHLGLVATSDLFCGIIDETLVLFGGGRVGEVDEEAVEFGLVLIFENLLWVSVICLRESRHSIVIVFASGVRNVNVPIAPRIGALRAGKSLEQRFLNIFELAGGCPLILVRHNDRS